MSCTDAVGVRLRDPRYSGRFYARARGSDLGYYLGGNLARTSGEAVPATLMHVAVVVQPGAVLQVVDVHAGRVIAPMPDHGGRIRDRAVVMLPDDTVSPERLGSLASAAHLAVAPRLEPRAHEGQASVRCAFYSGHNPLVRRSRFHDYKYSHANREESA